MSQMFYGDQNRWFVGLVIDVNDPLKLDRVKVRIHGIHSESTVDIPDNDLPWAQVNIPYGASISDSIKKFSYDIYYLKHTSIILDFLICLKTIRMVFN